MTDLWERVCARLNGYAGRICDILPETLSQHYPSAGIFVQSEVQEKEYADGTVCLRIPFQLRIRMKPRTVKERLRVLSSLEGLGEYLKKNRVREPLDGGVLLDVGAEGMPTRSAVFDNGSEEYKMRFYLTVMVAQKEEGTDELQD